MQPRLWVEPKKRKPKKDSPLEVEHARERFDRQNRMAAGIILANPQRYAGLPVEWADLWSKHHPQTLRRNYAL